MAEWDENSWQLATNLDRLLLDVSWRRNAPPLDREIIRNWHRIMMHGLAVPNPTHIGTYRGESTLKTTTVYVRATSAPYDRVYGVSPTNVSHDLGFFEVELRRRLIGLNANSNIETKARMAAWAHGEWVRIHPFANGNGRIARLIANWVLFRLHAAPVVRLRPRPEGIEYAHAACESMRDGSHERMVAWIQRHLEQAG